MNSPHRLFAAIAVITSSLFLANGYAEPIEFSEVSLFVRAGETESSIVQEVSRRKLVRALTPLQENTLKAQGAVDSLIQSLRRPALLLSEQDAAAFNSRRAQSQSERQRATAAKNEQREDGLHIFEIPVGHPINLSQWGGPDYEFAFSPAYRLDEGQPDAVLIDNVRTGTHVATYLGAGRPDDSTTIFDRRNYVSIMDRSFTRDLRIDRQHPIRKEGVPYTLYPVYAAGGVSLYYIGSSDDSVKLAVSKAAR